MFCQKCDLFRMRDTRPSRNGNGHLSRNLKVTHRAGSWMRVVASSCRGREKDGKRERERWKKNVPVMCVQHIKCILRSQEASTKFSCPLVGLRTRPHTKALNRLVPRSLTDDNIGRKRVRCLDGIRRSSGSQIKASIRVDRRDTHHTRAKPTHGSSFLSAM